MVSHSFTANMKLLLQSQSHYRCDTGVGMFLFIMLCITLSLKFQIQILDLDEIWYTIPYIHYAMKHSREKFDMNL
jgi:hypothetical protein